MDGGRLEKIRKGRYIKYGDGDCLINILACDL